MEVRGGPWIKRRLLAPLLLVLLLFNLLLFLLRVPPSPTTSPPAAPSASSDPLYSPSPSNLPLQAHQTKEDVEKLLEAERRIAHRVSVLREGCAQEPVPSKVLASSMDVAVRARTELLEDHRLSMCVVFKAGSTAWNYLIAQLINQKDIIESMKLYKMIDILKPSEKKFMEVSTGPYTRVLMAREPLERLLSAYRDRILDQRKFTHQAHHYAPLILLATRGVRYPNRDLYNINGTLKIVPTFNEFVRFLVGVMPQDYDPHWKPIHLLCSLCRFNYTDIVHMETFTDDIHYIMHKTGIDRKVDKSLLTSNSHKGIGNTQDLLVSYYSKLEPQILKVILKVYKKDFILFGYDPTHLLNRISPNKTINWRD